jgi:lambda-carrageenase
LRFKVAILIASVAALASWQRRMDSPYLPIDGNAWRLALTDVDGDGTNELIYGAYEGKVCAIRKSGARLWCRAIGGFPFAVAGVTSSKVAALAAAADGKLYALSRTGEIAWTWQTANSQALYTAVPFRSNGTILIATGGMDRTVTVLDLAGKVLNSRPVTQLVGRMAGADFDGDGNDELLVIDRRNEAELLRFEKSKLERVWQRRLAVPDSMKNWENPNGNFNVFSLQLADVDGDGKPEILAGDTFFNRQSVMLASGDGKPRWIAPPLNQNVSKDRWYELYSTAWVTAADVDAASDGKEIVSVAAGLLRVFSATGKLLVAAEAPIGFSDVLIDGDTLFLGSSPNGDRTIYRLPLKGDYAGALTKLQWQGSARQVQDTLDEIAAAVAKAPVSPSPAQLYDVQVGVQGVRTERDLERYRKQSAWFRSEFPYKNLRLIASTKLIEPTPPLNPNGKPWNLQRWRTDSITGTMTVDEILATAGLAEKHQIPTLFNIGHSCMPFITLETAEKVLKAAPNVTVGFLSAEDENPVEFPAFAKDYLRPLAELSKREGGKRTITKNKNLWWMSMPSQPAVFETLFAPEVRSVMQGRTEDSNSRSPEMNLMARFGLRQAGLLSSVHASTIGDLFSFNRFWQWEYPKQGSPWLRLLIAHTVLGADSFEYRSPGLISTENGISLPRMGQESMGVFLHMLGKGLLFTPSIEQQVGMSRVGIAVHPPPAKWITDAHNGHRPELWKPDPELEQAVLPRNGSLWGLTPTPAHALTRVLFHKQRQFGYHVPPTPYGAVAIVPAAFDLTKVRGVDEWWHTDGIAVWREGGPRLTGNQAAEALQSSFEAAAAKLPFRYLGDDVFFHSVEVERGVYRLFAIDPGWLDPVDREIAIAVQLQGSFRFRDMLRGVELMPVDGKLSVKVPAGGFRMLEARLEKRRK